MATQTSIINRALRFLGQGEVASATQSVQIALSANAAWDDSLDWCLRCHPWNFSQKWSSLAEEKERPAFAFNYSYLLPSDCLRLIDIRPTGEMDKIASEYSLVGRSIYTDIKPCLARYVFRNLDPTHWPSDFVEVLAIKIAIDIASVIVPADTAMRKDLDNRFFIALDIARRTDINETRPVEIDKASTCSLLTARRQGDDSWLG